MAEQGHAKNLENLKKARDFATSWGTSYAPTNPVLALANMNSVITAGETVADELQAARTPYRNATAAAEDAFDPLSKLVTRVMNALRISGVSDSVVEDAETYSRKIQGRRKEPAPEDDPSTPNVNEGQNSHSASQMSRAQRIENFDSLVSLLQSNDTFYKPNETGQGRNAGRYVSRSGGENAGGSDDVRPVFEQARRARRRLLCRRNGHCRDRQIVQTVCAGGVRQRQRGICTDTRPGI